MGIVSEKLSEIASKIRHDIVRSRKTLLDEYPLEQFEEYLHARPKTAGYFYVPPGLRRFWNNIIEVGDQKVLRLYNKLIILNLIEKNKKKLDALNLPKSIKDFYLKDFEMIIGEIDINPDDFYEYPKDRFLKDLNICALKLIPIGPGVIDLSAIPRSFLFKRGSIQFTKRLLFILLQVGGFKPFYRTHLYSRGLAEFNEAGWDRAFLIIAELLKTYNRVKGVFRSAWFIDPKLQAISPRLAYLRERFEQNGGGIFYIGSTPQDIKNAILKSPTRRRLYEEGKYTPTNYMAIWPRKQLINWAERYYTNNLEVIGGLASHHKEAMMQ